MICLRQRVWGPPHPSSLVPTPPPPGTSRGNSISNHKHATGFFTHHAGKCFLSAVKIKLQGHYSTHCAILSNLSHILFYHSTLSASIRPTTVALHAVSASIPCNSQGLRVLAKGWDIWIFIGLAPLLLTSEFF